eukprot:gene11015-12836_t
MFLWRRVYGKPVVSPSLTNYLLYSSTDKSSIQKWKNITIVGPPSTIISLTPTQVSEIDILSVHFTSTSFPFIPLAPMTLIFKNAADYPLVSATPPFPFGATGTVPNCKLVFGVHYSSYNPSPSLGMIYYITTQRPITNPGTGTDSTAPEILDLKWTPFGAYSYVVRVIAKDDISGVYQVLFGSNMFDTVQAKRITSPETGPSATMFEAIVTLGQSIYVRDYAYNQVTVAAPNYVVGNSISWIENRVPINTTEDDITDLYFLRNTMDVTNRTAENILYFKGGLDDPTYKPMLMLFPESMSLDTILKRPDLQFTGYYDGQTGYYAIPFKFRRNEFEGPVQYNLVLQDFLTPNSKVFVRRFGTNATLTIVSKTGDVMPPVVRRLAVKNTLTIPAVDDGVARYLNWNISVFDDYNGLELGYVEASSNLNPVPVRVYLDNSTYYYGDILDINGVWYIIKVPIPNKGVNQIFTLTGYLRDTSGNIAMSNSTDHIDPFHTHDYLDPISPTMINVTYESPMVDTAPPRLAKFNASPSIIDVGSLNRNITVDFTVQDNFGVYFKNAPVVYLSSLHDEILPMPSVYLGVSNNLYAFQVKFSIPYGFGYLDRLFLSIYGIYDNNFNIAGFTNTDLTDRGFTTAKITRQFSNGPYLESHSQVSQSGGQLNLLLHNVPENQYAMVTVLVYLVHVFAQMTGLVLIAQLDPNFSLLVDTDTDNNNDYDTICGASSKKGLGAAKLAGIIIGSVAIVVVITIVVVYFKFKTMKARKENKAMQHKLQYFASQ